MKKMLIAVFITAMTLAVTVPFAACGHTHSYGAWTTTKEPACTEQGERYRECECGDRQTEVLPAAGHRGDEWSNDGESHWKVCSVCGEPFDAGAHRLTDGVCTVCGHTALSPAALTFEINESGDGVTVTGTEDNGTLVDIPASVNGLPVTAIGERAFNGTAIREVRIPDSVKTIEDRAFLKCASLTSVTFGNGVESIGQYAFQGVAISEIDFPASLTTIGYCAFSKISGLKYLDIPETVITIDRHAFWACGVEKVKINGNTSKWAPGYNSLFYQCDNLKEAVFGENAGTTAYFEFRYAVNCESYVAENSKNFSSANGMLFNKDMTKLIACPKGRTSAIIPEGVTEIFSAYYNTSAAFYQCAKLESVQLPESLSIINDEAFAESGIKEIDIPDGVTMIDAKAFENCASLERIHIGKSCKSFSGSALKGCTALTSLTVSDENEYYVSTDNALIQRYKGVPCILLKANSRGDIPEGIHTIEQYTFADCTAENIVIPESMVEIAYAAFATCTNLKTVTFKGTEDWKVTGNGQSSSQAVAIDVTNAETNATNLVTTYSKYTWRTNFHPNVSHS